MNQLYNPQEFAALVLRAVGNTKKKEFARSEERRVGKECGS